MKTWPERVKARMKELGLTQEVLASKMGITRGAITHYLAGRRAPSLSQFQKLAMVLKTDPAWLQFGASALSKQTTQKINMNPTIQKIPLISWEQAKGLVDITKIEVKEYVPHLSTDKSRWYALKVKGDSMTAPTGHSKSFHAGDLIFIDPDKTANHGDCVIAIVPRSKEATFKQYVIDSGTRYLKPLNTQYPIVEINDSTHICGVVISCFRFCD